MPLIFDMVRGRPALMYLKRIGTAIVAPTGVTVTVDAAGALAGATSIPVTSLSAAVPKNTVLEFTATGGGAVITKVVVTADATASAVSLSVEAFEGASGDGIDAALVSTDKAVWDGLYTDIASNSLDFSVNEQTNELTAVTHGSATGVRVGVPEVTSVQPTISRQGLFFADGQLYKDIVKNAKTPNANWWAKYILPAADGTAAVTYEGLVRMFGVGHPTPADNLVQLSYSVRFINDAYSITTPA